jgi:hypothetical protein
MDEFFDRLATHNPGEGFGITALQVFTFIGGQSLSVDGEQVMAVNAFHNYMPMALRYTVMSLLNCASSILQCQS